MNAGQLATTWSRQRSVVCVAIRKAGLDVARGVVYTPEQQQKIMAYLPQQRTKQQHPATTKVPQQRRPQAPQQQRQQRVEQQHVVISLEEFKELKAQVAQLQTQLQEACTIWDKITKSLSLHASKLVDHEERLQDIIKWSKATGRVIRALWRNQPGHQPGDTPPFVKAVTPDDLDEGGRETVERLEAQDKETSAFFDALDKQRKVG